MYLFITLLLPAALASVLMPQSREAAGKNQTISIDPAVTYLLPNSFEGNVSEPFYSSTITHNAQIQSQLIAASSAAFISYDPEFLDLIGPAPVLQLVAEKSIPFADEMGTWVHDGQRNEVWMASAGVDGVSNLWVLDLNTSEVFQPKTSIPILNPNGGYYHQGTVYIAGDGDAAMPPCIYAVDPVTGNTSIVVNSYYGLRFGGPNDLTVVDRGAKSFLFFTDDPLSELYNGGEAPQLPDAVWRFDPQEKSLIPVIDRTDILVPNGIRVNANQSKLYVTDTPPATYGATLGLGGSASSAIYVFDLDEQAFPSNKRLFGLAERGVPDGIHIDDEGRVWTGESDGIVVRNTDGKIIGLFNSLTLLGENQTMPLQNFALPGDTLVILALEKIWTLKLTREIVA